MNPRLNECVLFDGRDVLANILDCVIGEGVIFQLTGQISIVRSQIKVTVTRQVKEDDLFLARFLGFKRFVNGCKDGVCGFRSRQDAFIAGKQDSSFKDLGLGNCHRFDQTLVVQ